MNKQKILNILKNTAAIIVIIAMFVVIFYQNRDRSIFKVGKDEKEELLAGNQDYSGTFSGGDIGAVDDVVAFLTTTEYSVVDKNGEFKKTPIAFSNPQIHTEGEWVACFEPDSKEITVFKRDAQAYTVNTENKIITAKVNKNGYLFTATEKEGYNCECMVYNRTGEAMFKWDVSKSEFLDGDVNTSNNKIAISLASAGDKKLVGEVFLIDTTTAEVVKKETFDSELFYTLNFNNNDTYTLLGSKSLTYFNSDGTKRWSYEFGNKTILKADVSNHDAMVLAFTSADMVAEGNPTDIVIVDRLGKVTAERSFDGMIDAISQNEELIALAFGRDVYIVNEKLRDKTTLESDSSIKKMILFKDGKHIFVLGNSGGKVIE